MKKCPYCGADIEDNARFCLYCMKSLAEKEEIPESKIKSRRLPIFAGAFLLLAVCVALTLVFGSKHTDKVSESGEQLEQSESETDIPVSGEAYEEGGHVAAAADDVLDDVPEKKEDTVQNGGSNATEEGSKSSGKDTQGESQGTPVPIEDDKEGQSTPTAQPTQDEQTPEDGKTEQGTVTPDIAPEPPQEEPTVTPEPEKTTTPAKFIYRAATNRDEWDMSRGVPVNSIVITGVETAASDGVYVIPNTIDGKSVVAVMANAFSGAEAGDKVKAVVIPSTVKTVWNYAFSSCRNLKDVYLCANVYIENAAFADTSKRNVTLTIRSSSSCNDRNFREYSSAASSYGAVWKLWTNVSEFY